MKLPYPFPHLSPFPSWVGLDSGRLDVFGMIIFVHTRACINLDMDCFHTAVIFEVVFYCYCKEHKGPET